MNKTANRARVVDSEKVEGNSSKPIKSLKLFPSNSFAKKIKVVLIEVMLDYVRLYTLTSVFQSKAKILSVLLSISTAESAVESAAESF